MAVLSGGLPPVLLAPRHAPNLMPGLRKMALKLDDLIGKKKEAAQVLDLSKATANSAEEFKRIMEKIPEFKIKPEKVKPEDVKIHDRPGRGRKGVRGTRSGQGVYQFADPVPQDMQGVRLDDLSSVGIHWTMLTTLRPKSKLEEEYFSRLVELGRLRLQTEEKDKKIPVTTFLRRMKNKSGIIESRFISCKECGEEFCQQETCCMFQYDQFKRPSSAEGWKKVAEVHDEDDLASKKKAKKYTYGKKKKKKKKQQGSTANNKATGSRSKSPKKKGEASGGGEEEGKARRKRKAKGQKEHKRKHGNETAVKGTGKLPRRKRAWVHRHLEKESEKEEEE